MNIRILHLRNICNRLLSTSEQHCLHTKHGLRASVGEISSDSQHASIVKINVTKTTHLGEYLDASNKETEAILGENMIVYNDFISEHEEQQMFDELHPYLRRLRYEYDHWDDAIHGFRETERREWTAKNQGILQRVRELAFPPGTSQLAHVHVLDLERNGYIKPHIDSVRFCGSTIAGLSLLSSSVMRLVHDKKKDCWADVYLKQRSMYIMKGPARYDYTHEVLPEVDSKFKGEQVLRDRRISVICRNEPSASALDQ